MGILRFLIFAAVAIAAFAPVGRADPSGLPSLGSASLLFTLGADDRVVLWAYDPVSLDLVGGSMLYLPGEVIMRATALATNPVDGRLYAMVFLDGEDASELITLDTATGLAESIGSTEHLFASIAFDAAGTLYGVTRLDQEGLDAGELYEIETDSGEATLVAELSGDFSANHAIAFHPSDGKLYHLWGCPAAMESVDIANALAVTTISVSGVPVCGVVAISMGRNRLPARQP